MVHTTAGRRGGNLQFERQITQLGATRQERRIRVSVYSSDPKVLTRVGVLVDKLIADEEWDVLRALRDKKVTLPDLLAADRKGKARLTLSKVKLEALLWDPTEPAQRSEMGAITRTLAAMRDGPTRRRYFDSFKRLKQKASHWLPADATVEALTRVDWPALAAQWGGSGADWMHLRRAVSRFATLYFGDKYDPFARALRTAIPTKRVKKRRPKVTPDEFRRVCGFAPEHAANAFWALLITGFRVRTEYLRLDKPHLFAATHTCEVPGTKTEGSDAAVDVDPRLWFMLERAVPSRLKYKWLHIYWTRACVAAGVGRRVGTGEWVTVPAPRPAHRPKAGELPQTIRVERTRYVGPTLHDIRHLHGQWAINQGVAESKVQGSLRHTNPGQTRDYVMQQGTRDVSAGLADIILGAPSNPRRRKA